MKNTGSGALGFVAEDALGGPAMRRRKAASGCVAAYSRCEASSSNAALYGPIEDLRCANWELQAQQAELQALVAELITANVEYESKIRQWTDLSRERNTLEVELMHALQQRDRFLATLSHELRNPMAAIRNSLAVLKHPHAVEDERQNALQTLDRQAFQMAYLLDDLLDVCCSIHGKIRYQMRCLDLRRVVLDAVVALQPSISQQRHLLQCTVGDKPVLVHGDEARLLQVVENLLTNACKYTPCGGAIRVELAQCNDRCQLTVSDTGQGISRDMLDKIFDVFIQSDSNLDRSDAGMGLGLTVVKALVEDHGGTIVAHSDGLGKGADFTVDLPLGRLEEISEPSPKTELVELSAKQATRILVIEDNPDARQMLDLLLQLEGFDVTSCEDGSSGLEQMLANMPEFALVDIGLPHVDGYEVAQRFRALCPTAKVRLIALTGYGQSADILRAREAGFDAHLTKPVDPDQLIAMLGGT